MEFLVKAKRYGDSVEFDIEAGDTKAGLVAAKREANDIFGYIPGQAGAPTVSLKPMPEQEGK